MSSAEYTSGRNVGILIQNTNMKKRKKIVLLLGAGFPVAWGAPFSKDILDRIIEDKEYTSNPQLSSSASFLRLNVLSSLN